MASAKRTSPQVNQLLYLLLSPDHIDCPDAVVLGKLNDLAAKHGASSTLEQPLLLRYVKHIKEAADGEGVDINLACSLITKLLWNCSLRCSPRISITAVGAALVSWVSCGTNTQDLC